MSSDPNNSQSRKVGSIRRRLLGAWASRRFGLLFGGGLSLLLLAAVLFLGGAEYAHFGTLRVKTERHFSPERGADGSVSEIWYEAKPRNDESAEALKLAVRKPGRALLIGWGSVFALRLLGLLAFSLPEYNRKIKEILRPIDELALKADELSRMEFGEDKYRLIEDAISHLDADDAAGLSLQDRDLMGIEAAINNLLTRVRESNRQQARFVNDASHELRTPIAVIGGYADMLARWGKNDEKVLEESIAAIRTETARMQHLVEQLLFLARGDSGRTQLQKETVSPGALMREAYEESVMIDEKHIYRFTDGTGELNLQADPGLLKQAVRILIDNAAKYTAEGDEILLSTGRDGDKLFLQVQDCGIGMAQSNVPHIFERFYRADEARSYEGTGLGLAIAKWIVDKHGGYFEILSREEIGTRIRIVLP